LAQTWQAPQLKNNLETVNATSGKSSKNQSKVVSPA
jgi:hypothetical protein